MLSCRIHLVRGYLRAALSHSPLARRSLAEKAISSPTENNVRDGHVTPLRDPPPHSRPPPNPFPPPSPISSAGSISILHNISEIYTGFRYGTPKVRAADLSASDFSYIARTARKRRHAPVLDHLARDLLASWSIMSPSHIALLLNPANVPFFPPSTVMALYKALPPSDQPAHAAAVLSHPEAAQHPPLLDLLAESVGRHLPDSRALFWPAFRILAHLAEQRRNQQALTLFQRLIDVQLIPPEAIRSANRALRDFRVIIMNTVIRAYMFWNAHAQAGELMLQLLISFRDKDMDDSNAALAIDVLYALMEHPEVTELGCAISLVKELSVRPRGPFVPHSLIQQMYEACRRHDMAPSADHLYSFTQWDTVQSLHQYPPPRGPPLLWLLKHYVLDTKAIYRVRKLVTHVVDAQEPIPPPIRASFIMIIADQGFATQTRRLYERYSKGRYGALVAGHAALLVQISTLFASLIRHEKKKIRALRNRNPLAAGVTVQDDQNDPWDEIDAAALARQQELERRQERLDDFVAFCREVLQEYRKAKEPLMDASQADLNALARAYFALGEIYEGYQVFGVMTARQQVPDRLDVNVALSAVARQNPRVGMGMIRQMIKRGVVPDNVALGTVLHYALKWRRLEIVQELFALSKSLNRPFTLKTMDSVIRASIVYSRGDREAVRDNLKRALEVIKANLTAPYLASIDMGKFCANAAMGAGEAEMAFEFWQLLLKDNAQWGDFQQRFLRGRLVKLIRRGEAEKRIEEAEANAMVLALEKRA